MSNIYKLYVEICQTLYLIKNIKKLKFNIGLRVLVELLELSSTIKKINYASRDSPCLMKT